MEDLSQPALSDNEPADQVATPQASAATGAPARPTWATHAGARLSAIGVAVVCVSIFLPWFSSLSGFPYTSGSTSADGWGLLIQPLVLIFPYGLYYPLFCGLGLLALIVEGVVGYVLLASVSAAFEPGIPRPKWWHIGALAVPMLLLLAALVYTGFYLAEIGYWLNLAGFILVYVGSLFQIRTANRVGR